MGRLTQQSGGRLQQPASVQTKEPGFIDKFSKIGEKATQFFGDITGLRGSLEYVTKLGTKEQQPLKQGLGSLGKLGLNLATFGTPGIAANLGLRGAVGLGARVAEGGLTGAIFKATDNLEKNKPIGQDVGAAMAIGGAIPLVGSATQKILGATGKKIQQTVIRPSASDIKDGFKIETVNKYDLGGSLGQMAHKTQDKLDDLSQQLQQKVGRRDISLDLNEIFQRTQKALGGARAKNFGNIGSSKRILDNLASEIDEVSGNGLVDLAEAQTIKQASGLKGSWVFGSADPDASAIERVYTAFYRELRQEIEKKAPAGVAEINKQISELIPVMNAIVRRIPIAERNNVLSLTDVISLGFASVHPSSAALLAVNKLSKSGRVGNILTKLGEAPVSNIGKRIFNP